MLENEKSNYGKVSRNKRQPKWKRELWKRAQRAKTMGNKTKRKNKQK